MVIAMAIQTTSESRYAAFHFGPDRHDLCTYLQRHYLELTHVPLPTEPESRKQHIQQRNAAYRRWMTVQRQLFSEKPFNPNR